MLSRILPVIAVCVSLPAFAEARFFAAIEDLPLAPGMTEDEHASADFAGPGGGVIASSATGVGSTTSVRIFYEQTLPQLGWSESPGQNGELLFQRGREQLTLRTQQNGPIARLFVRLIERPASMSAD